MNRWACRSLPSKCSLSHPPHAPWGRLFFFSVSIPPSSIPAITVDCAKVSTSRYLALIRAVRASSASAACVTLSGVLIYPSSLVRSARSSLGSTPSAAANSVGHLFGLKSSEHLRCPFLVIVTASQQVLNFDIKRCGQASNSPRLRVTTSVLVLPYPVMIRVANAGEFPQRIPSPMPRRSQLLWVYLYVRHNGEYITLC